MESPLIETPEGKREPNISECVSDASVDAINNCFDKNLWAATQHDSPAILRNPFAGRHNLFYCIKLLHAYPRHLHHLAPARDFVDEMLTELFGRTAQRLAAISRHALGDIRGLCRFD